MKLSNILKPGMKGAFYGRHSTDKQDMLMQQNSVNKLMKKYKCEIIKEYLDANVSAVKKPMEKREQLQNLIEGVRNKEYEFIVVYKSDRLARDPHEHLIIRAIMDEYNTPVVISSTEDTYKKTNDLLVQLMEDGFTKYESDNIRIRTYDGKEAKAQTGNWLGGHPPYGYRYNKKFKFVEAIPQELNTVKQIFDLYKKNHGFQSIADKLNSIDSEINWTKKKVKDIIINPIYAGYVSWRKRSKGVINERNLWIMAPNDLIEPIITKEEWEICFQLFLKRRLKQVSPKYYNTSYLLYDLVECKDCRVKLETKDQRTEQNGKTYGDKIYRCPSCGLRCSADDLHTAIVDDILNDIRVRTFNQVYDEVLASLDEEVKALENEISVLNKNKDEYVILLDRLKEELINLMKSKYDERIIKSLYYYYLDVQKNKKNTKTLIEAKIKQIKIHKDAKFNRAAWSNIIENVIQDRKQINDMDLRRLLIPLVEYVKVDQGMKLEYKLRIDNTKRKGSNQIQFQF